MKVGWHQELIERHWVQSTWEKRLFLREATLMDSQSWLSENEAITMQIFIHDRLAQGLLSGYPMKPLSSYI